jgi:ATP-dependent helicase HrpA
VIDAGLARVKRYSVRNKTTLLQIEKVSQAAANQRAGRCGRTQDGICVRLYSEEDFAARPLYTEPEILRSSLASVILRMAALDLPEVAQFPFLEAPGNRAIADGYQLLQELDAVDASRALTPLGRELAAAAARSADRTHRAGGARWRVSRRSAGDRERAGGARSARASARTATGGGPGAFAFWRRPLRFLSLVALWEFFADATAQKLSHRHLVEACCRAQFVSFLRLSEWRDVHRQLVATLEEAGWKWPSALPKSFDDAALRRCTAVLAGLLGNIGVKAEPDEHYAGTRGLRFYLHPGSGLARKGAKWILAAELTETSRLFARCAARVEPEWIEEIAGERVARDYSSRTGKKSAARSSPASA